MSHPFMHVESQGRSDPISITSQRPIIFWVSDMYSSRVASTVFTKYEVCSEIGQVRPALVIGWLDIIHFWYAVAKRKASGSSQERLRPVMSDQIAGRS